MNQGKLDKIKQEMVRVNIEILGISELKWTIISITVGTNPLEEMEWPSQSARVQNAILGCNLKNDRMISVRFQGKPFNITVVQVYAPTTDVKEAEVEQFCEDLQDLLELTHTHTQDALSSQVSGIQKWEVKRYLE